VLKLVAVALTQYLCTAMAPTGSWDKYKSAQ